MEQPTDDAHMRSLLNELNQESQLLDEELRQLESIETSVRNQLQSQNTECHEALKRKNDLANALSKLEFVVEQHNNEYKILETQSSLLHSEIDALSAGRKDSKSRFKAEVDNYVSPVAKIFMEDCAAAKLYTEKGLSESLKNIEDKMVAVDENLKKAAEELNEINQEMNKVSASTHPDHEMAITTEQRQCILKIFNDENSAAHWTLASLQEKKKNKKD